MKSNATRQASKHAAHPDSGRVRDEASLLLRLIERFFAALKHKKFFTRRLSMQRMWRCKPLSHKHFSRVHSHSQPIEKRME
jgi:hypothetical protein